jgi:transposase
MGRRLQVRAVTDEERQAVARLARSRTAPARAVERAQVVRAALEGAAVEDIAVRLQLARTTVYLWLHRFETRGLAGLEDQPREGRPPTSTREPVGEIVATALTAPQTLDRPFQSWTLDRLVAYLSERKGSAMKRSRLNEVLLTEGLRWRKQETWFGERVAPDFAQKRGRSQRSTSARRRAAW